MLRKTISRVMLVLLVTSMLAVAFKVQFAANSSNALFSVPITISNAESQPVPSPFQELLTINSSAYSSYEASNLQNVEFLYPNGTVIPSWLESGNSATSTSTLYWLKIQGGIPPDSSITIDMVFASPSTSLFNRETTGEAPTLSPTYGEYDDGANVFSFYDNFAGSSLSSQWIVNLGNGSLEVNNGLAINYVANEYLWPGYVASSSQFGPGTVFDADVIYIGDVNNVGYFNLHEPLEEQTGGPGYSGTFIRCACEKTYPDQWNTGGEANMCGNTYGSIVNAEGISGIYTVDVIDSTSSLQYVNYNQGNSNLPVTTNYPGYPASVGFAAASDYVDVQWARVRVLPPNGVMPSISGIAAGMTEATSVSCSAHIVPIRQPVTCTANVSGFNPTGTISWSTSSSTGNFGQSVCTLSNGTCSTTYVDNLTGSTTITASYSGDSNNPPSSGSTNLIVTSGGPIYYSANYTSIQATFNAAPPGATVIIAAGFYTESLIIDKPLTIIGEKDLPVFSGGTSAIYLILESGASGSIVTGIEITNWFAGIVVDNASNVSIYGNIMASIGSSGIVLDGNNATDNTIYGNVFLDVPTPINLTASLGNNTVYGNAFVSENSVTLNVGADGNSIYGNTIVGNEIVLNLTGSNGNAVYHNNFVSTNQITVLASGNNSWDTGLPSGGNYWSTTPNIVGGNNTDNYPLTQPWALVAGHYVGVACVVVSKPVVSQGFSINLTTCLINEGEYAETFNVTAYANATAIGIHAVSNLNATGLSILTFNWNTTGLACGNYTISAYAQPVTGQNDTSGDTFTLGTVKVTIPGDVNGDFKVSLADLVLLANAYGSKPDNAKWNPTADINGNGIVGLSDLVIMANRYGQHYP